MCECVWATVAPASQRAVGGGKHRRYSSLFSFILKAGPGGIVGNAEFRTMKPDWMGGGGIFVEVLLSAVQVSNLLPVFFAVNC